MHYLHKKIGPKGFMDIKNNLAKAFDRVKCEIFLFLCSIQQGLVLSSLILLLNACYTTFFLLRI